MKKLEDRILTDGVVADGDVLKVGSFLNQQIDVELGCEMAREFYRLFEKDGVNKIVTVEASGIGLACLTAQYFHCPVVFAKKSRSSNIAGDVYVAEAYSYTHAKTFSVIIPRDYISASDRVLVVDDFLASGNAVHALLSILEQAGASVAGIGIAVEKDYQGGGNELRAKGIRVESLARIESMSPEQGIKFTQQ